MPGAPRTPARANPGPPPSIRQLACLNLQPPEIPPFFHVSPAGIYLISINLRQTSVGIEQGREPHTIMKQTFGFCCAAATMLAAGAAQASTVGTTMPVTALTVNACAVAATPMVFGTLNMLGGAANDSQSSVVVTCTPGTPYEVALDHGAHAVGNVRYLTPAIGTGSVPYALYSNAARTAAWGYTSGTDTVNGTAGLLPTTLTVYGRVPAGAPLVAAKTYADVVTVTVSF